GEPLLQVPGMSTAPAGARAIRQVVPRIAIAIVSPPLGTWNMGTWFMQPSSTRKSPFALLVVTVADADKPPDWTKQDAKVGALRARVPGSRGLPVLGTVPAVCETPHLTVVLPMVNTA